ncbi:MAG: XisI protein [Candidatus Promineifilaceae bacterium]
MDKVTYYRQLVMQVMNEYIDLMRHSSAETSHLHILYDEERDHYMLSTIGWKGKRRIRAITVYVRLENEKIWIEEDLTDYSIASHLLALNVPKSDIVLAFHYPKFRPLTEFAVV